MKEDSNKTNTIIAVGIVAIIVVLIGGFTYLEFNNSNDSVEDEAVADSVTEGAPGAEEMVDGARPDMGDRQVGGRQMTSPEELEAIENKDYSAWTAAVGVDNPIVEYITSEEDFLLFIEMEEAVASGDQETAEEIRLELGIPERDDSMAQPPIQ